MEVNLLNWNINDMNLPPQLPPPNDWMVEVKFTIPETGATILSLRLYIYIKRDGNKGSMG
jgi:hypothetical protein